MGLAPGTRLGPYEIVAPLGAGGMGEVYRARDTRLDRDVAVKVLPPTFATDPDRVRRFEQEARAAAALNHPNILAVYDVGQHDGAPYIVSELLQGESLRERLQGGTLPRHRAIDIAVQVAHGLAAAHERGIVHRDLKPDNVFITLGGGVKILDFGLAKLAYAHAAASAVSLLPTVAPDTLPGVVLGTVSYMAPEQVRGQTADVRSDIFALGVTLYEMLSGRRAFSGDTPADTMSAILREEPPQLDAAAYGLPLALARIVQRCLEKNPSGRFQSASDLAFALEALSSSRTQVEAGPTSPGADASGRVLPARDRWTRVATHAGSALAAAALTLLLVAGRGTDAPVSSEAPVLRATIELPADAPLALGSQVPRIGIESPAVAVSPDGSRVAYVAETKSGTAIYTRTLDATDVRPVPGTEGAIHVFFSPDSRWLGFLTNDKVMKVPVEGGTPLTLCDARVPVRATWTSDDVIYFDEDQGFRVSRISAAGGTPEPIEVPPFVLMSEALAGGDILATDWSAAGVSQDYADIVLITSAGEKRLLVRGGFQGRYVAPGFLVFSRNGSLLAVPFDLATRTVKGEPTPIAANVSMESMFNILHASFSDNGLLAYIPGTNRSTGRLAWVDRDGRVDFVATPPRVYGVVDLAPDGSRAAVHVGDVTDYIWLYDFGRREGRRVATAQNAGWPIWTRDGQSLTHSAWVLPRTRMDVAVQSADRAAAATRVASNIAGQVISGSWSPNGRILAISVLTEEGLRRALVGDNGQVSGVVTRNIEQWGNDFSPDGRWVAFTSNETGQFEIYVESYPDRKTVRQISVDGGTEPRWCRCGELFYRNGNRWMSTRIRTQPDLQWDPPQLAFETDFIDTPGRSYDISQDGRRLLVVKRANPDVRDRIDIIANWTALLENAIR